MVLWLVCHYGVNKDGPLACMSLRSRQRWSFGLLGTEETTKMVFWFVCLYVAHKDGLLTC